MSSSPPSSSCAALNGDGQDDRADDPVRSEAARSVNPWLALVTIAIGVLLVALDGTITAVANPVLGAQLGASLGGLQWVTNIYLLALASTLVLAGRLGDRWGRRRVFLIGVTGFAIASAVVGLAVSVEMAVVGRGLQGLFGSLIITNAISLLRLSFPPERLPIALSTFAAVIGASSAAGPIIGGVLVEQLSWRWAFLINAPIAVVGVVAGLRLLRRGEAAPGGRFDVPGVALLMATMLTLVFGLITAPETSWTDPVVVACLALALVLGAAFVLVERRAEDPLLPLSLFADRSVSAAAGLTVLTFFSLVGSPRGGRRRCDRTPRFSSPTGSPADNGDFRDGPARRPVIPAAAQLLASGGDPPTR